MFLIGGYIIFHHYCYLVGTHVPYKCFFSSILEYELWYPSSGHSEMIHISESVFCKKGQQLLQNCSIYLNSVVKIKSGIHPMIFFPPWADTVHYLPIAPPSSSVPKMNIYIDLPNGVFFPWAGTILYFQSYLLIFEPWYQNWLLRWDH